MGGNKLALCNGQAQTPSNSLESIKDWMLKTRTYMNSREEVIAFWYIFPVYTLLLISHFSVTEKFYSKPNKWKCISVLLCLQNRHKCVLQRISKLLTFHSSICFAHWFWARMQYVIHPNPTIIIENVLKYT